MRPFSSIEALAISARGRRGICASNSAATASARRREGVAQNGSGVFIVLGLREQVGGHHGGVRLIVRDDKDLAGPGDHVDRHLPEDLPLGLGNKSVARADDFVHRRYALRPVGQRRHGLRAAHLEDPSTPPSCAAARMSGATLPSRGAALP